MQSVKHILVIRFSSMGDVAMTVPVIKNVLEQHPSLQITVVSNALFLPLFDGLERCTFYPVFLKQQHKGPGGIWRLYNELNKQVSFDAVADLHGVLRSYLLSFFFKMKGSRVAVVDKGRGEKKSLTRKTNKICRPILSTHERYAEVFRKIGLPVQLRSRQPVYIKKPVPKDMPPVFSPGNKIIGIAPFAQYAEKMYPFQKTGVLIEQLAAAGYTILLFGGGKNECAALEKIEQDFDSVFSVAGKYSLAEELAIMSNLDCMLSMDSANMHLASLFNVPVVSIWGATHRYAGFNGWAQDEKNIVEIGLYCRPCSVFGNKPCYRGDHACMNRISEEVIFTKLVLLAG